MSAMRIRAAGSETAPGVTTLLVMVALVLGVSLCLFDAHCDDSAALDLCLGMLVAVLVVMLPCHLQPSGMLSALAPVVLPTAARRVLDPPPRLS
jgi:hypothetical protein